MPPKSAFWPIKEIDSVRFSRKIHTLMQAAYNIEAQLLGVENFYPLKRTSEEIAASGNCFLGCTQGVNLMGLCELEVPSAGAVSDGTVLIASTVVSPTTFRQGIASALLKHVLEAYSGSKIVVSTAEANLPAVRLYQTNGFVITHRTTLPDGMKLVELQYTQI